jgi:SOS response regulatory protein OraA/RecX
LDQAIERKLRGKASKDLDEKGKARIVRALAGQGFRIDAILKKLR